MDNYLLALDHVPGLGNVRFKRLIEYFGDAKSAWAAKPKDWEVLKIPHESIQAWQKLKKEDDVEKYSKELEGLDANSLNMFEENYPKLLKEIPDAPFLLYYQGDISLLQRKAIAVVGTRKITGYGQVVTEKLTKELAESGLVIISGLAKGVDSLAHRSALSVDGATIAVFGTSLSEIYPPENKELAKEILSKGGLLLSEHYLNYPVAPGLFPARNRIISGLSLGVLVTEAAEDSGSLITARLAIDQGREVFAVPGPITSSLSSGPTELIKQGAKLVSSSEDILVELGINKVNKSKVGKIDIEGLNDLEKEILTLLDQQQQHLDEICRQLRKTSAQVGAALIKMEIQGLVQNMGRGVYLKRF